MRTKLLHTANGQRSFAIVLGTGDEAIACIQRFADEEGVASAQFTAIGAISGGVLGYFDWEAKRYLRTPVREQVEVASFIGDVALTQDGRHSIHVHVVLGRRDGTALAGHLFEATVRPTLEVMVTENPAYLRKRHDDASGLALIDLGDD